MHKESQITEFFLRRITHWRRDEGANLSLDKAMVERQRVGGESVYNCKIEGLQLRIFKIEKYKKVGDKLCNKIKAMRRWIPATPLQDRDFH